jgi:hypothetical protein
MPTYKIGYVHTTLFLTRSSHSAVGQLPPVLLPRLRLALRVAEKGRTFVRIFVRKFVRRFGPTHEVGEVGLLGEVAIVVGAVRLFEAGAEAKVGQLDVAPGVEKQVVRFDVPEKKVSEFEFESGRE